MRDRILITTVNIPLRFCKRKKCILFKETWDGDFPMVDRHNFMKILNKSQSNKEKRKKTAKDLKRP